MLELIEGLEARDIYMAVTRLEMRYNTKVIQLFSDSGTQLAPALLGKKRSAFQHKLGRLWAVTNNVPYSQFRNGVERKVSLLKRIMKQVISGMPGPNRVLVPRDLLTTAILTATSIVNNTPYQEVVGSSRLLAPADFIAPWRAAPPSVKDLPP